MNSCIAPDNRGGWWISQNRAADAVLIPSLIHIGTDGLVNFNSGANPSLIVNSVLAGMAVSNDGTRLAMGCQDEVKIFDVTYSETGIPTLTRLHSIKPAMGTNTAGISMDRAGNVYVISYSSQRLGVWSLPKVENQFTTPAPSNQLIVVVKTGLDQVPDASQMVRTYPNPVKDNIAIECSGSIMEMIGLYDVNGRLVQTENVQSNKIDLSVSGLQPGIYILKVKTTAGMAVKRIMKQ